MESPKPLVRVRPSGTRKLSLSTADLVTAYELGASIRTLGFATGLSASTVRSRLGDQVQIRPYPVARPDLAPQRVALGAALRAARQAAGLSMARAGERAREQFTGPLKSGNMSGWEHGRGVLRPDVVAALADVYGVPEPEKARLVELARVVHARLQSGT